MIAVGVIGIILAFALLLFLTMKNWSTIIVAMLSVVVVALFNQLNVTEALTSTYVSGICSIITSIFTLVLLGTILGKLYTETGAAVSIANTFIRAFVDKCTGEKKIRVACAVLIIVSCLFQFGGIDSFIVMFTTFPIIVTMFRKLNLPRKYIPGMLLCSVGVGACPGAPTVHNVLPAALLGTSSTAGAIPGVIAFLIIEIGAWFMISTMIVRAVRRGEVYDEGNMDHVPEFDGSRELPNFVVSLLPLILVFVLYTIVGLDITYALSGGIVLCIILMGKKIQPAQGMSLGGQIVSVLGSGAVASTKAIIEISVIGGLAAVVAATAAFENISSTLLALPINPYWIVLIAVFILVALTSSPPAGLNIIIPLFSTYLISQAGTLGIVADAAIVHRICSIACLSFETLPWNGMIVVALSMSNIKHKEGYMPMFLASVAFPAIAAVVATVLFIAFPGLA